MTLTAMDKFYSIIFGIIVVAAIGLQVGKYTQDKGKVIIGETKIKVEIADTLEEIRNGLSNRESLDDDRGMLFVFAEPGEPAFWMKDMKFPIDIIWIQNDRVVDIAPNLPVVAGEFLSTYTPREPANYVLEVNAGFAAEHRIEVGDKVDIRF
jgi:uncharacterized membrane protein (UPF0127 family)